MADLDVALDHPLEPAVHDRAMSRKAETRAHAGAAAPPTPPSKAAGAPKTAPATSTAKAAPTKKPSKSVRRVAAATSVLEKTIGYRFSDPDMLERALTHISALKGAGRASSYQRLEFLGDHVLGLAISEMLFATFPKADEGELSRRLADLVRRETCADVARAVDLGASLRLGASEARTGGRTRGAILADVCESLIGAIFLDGGYKAALAFVERFWAERMRKPARPLRDPKTVLQEWAQARGLPTPSYREVERTGPHHDPEFRVAVSLPQREPAEGKGRSKRAAEQAAASALLSREGVRADG
jgi:ribonuclease III